MNKVLVALAFAGVAATGTIGTLNESDIGSVGSAFGEVKKKVSYAVTEPQFAFFGIADGVLETVDYDGVKNTKVKAVTKEDLVSDSHSGKYAIDVSNKSLGIRFGILPAQKNGFYTFSFWTKQLSDSGEKRFSIRFDNMDTHNSRAYYAAGKVSLKVGEWVQYTYDFTSTHFENGGYIDSRTSLTISALGDFLIDDITLKDADGTNYICDGDFEPVELLGWKYGAMGVGAAKQDDGSVFFGVSSWDIKTMAQMGEGYFQIKPKANAGVGAVVTFDYLGKHVQAMNRNGYDWGTAASNSNVTGWANYSYTLKGEVSTAGDIYFGGNQYQTLCYIKNMSVKDSEGNELLPSKLTKEGYAESFAESILEDVVCDNGVTAPSESTWGNIRYCFENMPTKAQAYIKSLTPKADGTTTERGLYKYSYIVSKYGSKYYDYLGFKGTSKSLANPMLVDGTEKGSIFAGVGIAFSGLIIALFFVVTNKKKKSNLR